MSILYGIFILMSNIFRIFLSHNYIFLFFYRKFSPISPNVLNNWRFCCCD